MLFYLAVIWQITAIAGIANGPRQYSIFSWIGVNLFG